MVFSNEQKYHSRITSDYVLSETFTRVRYDAGHSTAMKFHQLVTEAERSGQLRIDWVGKEIYDKAWEIFKKYSDQIFSFTDCTSFAIVKKAKINEIFAFDEGFSYSSHNRNEVPMKK